MSGELAAPVGALLFDLDEVAPDGVCSRVEDLGERLVRASELDVDVVMLASDSEHVVDECLRVRPAGPGRLVVWIGEGEEIHEVRPQGPCKVAGARCGDPLAWLTQHVFELRRPEGILVVQGETRSTGRSGGRAGVLAAATAGPAIASLEGPVDRVVRVQAFPRGEALLDVLDSVITAHEAFPQPVEDPSWLLKVEGFDPLREREYESWFTVSNGRTGTRGSVEEGTEASAPGVYVAGLYGRLEGDIPGPGLLIGPEWFALSPRAADEAINLDRGEILEHTRILDLRQGILLRTWRQRLPSGTEVSFRSARFASLAEREVLVLEANARSTGARVGLTGDIPLPPGASALESAETQGRGDRLEVDVRARGGGTARFAISTRKEGDRIERVAVVVRDPLGLPPVGDAQGILRRVKAEGVSTIRARHRASWRERWRDTEVAVDGDPRAQGALRFALYHLISAGDPDSDLASIGARGLSGPGYMGHVFWDTDVFVTPVLIFTHPATARGLLAYRYRTLPAARARARTLGYRGALYAWESADTGEEATPAHGMRPDGRRIPILTGLQEHHISADVAWATWRYWEATRDEVFLVGMGAEIVLETARFWSSRARWGRDDRYHIGRVIGPDEYHEGVRDNAFTNALAGWNLERGLEVADLLRGLDQTGWKTLAGRLELGARELRRWRAVADGLAYGFDPRTLLYEQFAGFFDLEDVRAADLAPRPFGADVLLPQRRIHRAQIVKQADVLMLAHMLPEVVSREVARANYAYYEPRTCHGSSLSPAVHAAVAARAGLPEEALEYFRMAAAIDLGDRMGNAAQGVHMGTMGGLWQAAVLGLGGVRPDGDVLRVDPRLPSAWTRLAFPLQWRGTHLHVEASGDLVVLTLDAPARVAVGAGAAWQLAPGRYRARRLDGGWSHPEREEER